MYGSIKMSENLQNLVQVYRRLQRIEVNKHFTKFHWQNFG